MDRHLAPLRGFGSPPRMRGKRTSVIVRVCVRGSPPRMRGKLYLYSREWREQRITPADAGKTFRAGGKAQCPAGSPPRMRGKLLIVVDIVVWVGITPADAGKTMQGIFKWLTDGDHPRRCGENAASVFPISARQGSPPRMRGKLVGRKRQLVPVGITPADAGKTGYLPHVQAGARDHPRGCGENVKSIRFSDRLVGSPPQVRGKPM